MKFCGRVENAIETWLESKKSSLITLTKVTPSRQSPQENRCVFQGLSNLTHRNTFFLKYSLSSFKASLSSNFPLSTGGSSSDYFMGFFLPYVHILMLMFFLTLSSALQSSLSTYSSEAMSSFTTIFITSIQ